MALKASLVQGYRAAAGQHQLNIEHRILPNSKQQGPNTELIQSYGGTSVEYSPSLQWPSGKVVFFFLNRSEHNSWVSPEIWLDLDIWQERKKIFLCCHDMNTGVSFWQSMEERVSGRLIALWWEISLLNFLSLFLSLMLSQHFDVSLLQTRLKQWVLIFLLV